MKWLIISLSLFGFSGVASSSKFQDKNLDSILSNDFSVLIAAAEAGGSSEPSAGYGKSTETAGKYKSSSSDHSAQVKKKSSSHAKPGGGSNFVYYFGFVALILLLVGGIWFLTIHGSRQKTFGERIISTFLCASLSLFVCVVSLGGASIYNVKSLGHEIVEIAELQIPLTSKMTAVVEHQLEQSLAMERYMRLEEVKFKNDFEYLAVKVDKEIIEAEEIAASGEQYALNQADLQRIISIEEHLKEIEHKHKAYNEHAREIFTMIEAGETGSHLKELEHKIELEADHLIKDLEGFLLDIEHDTEQAAYKAEYHEIFILNLISILSVLAFLISAFFLWFSRKNIVAILHEIMDNLSGSAENITAAASQAMQGSQSLSEGTSESSAALQETASSITEISSMVQKNNENAKEARSLSLESRKSAEVGEKEINNLISNMHEIAKSSKQVEEITSVIDDIAFQTNLLALNAAVEAARAGDQGKGFAVVAEAVRNLAQRSAESAKEISSLIKENVSQANAGVKVADDGGKALNEIVLHAKKVSDLINEVSAASEEQSEGLQQITAAVSQIQTTTERNASTSEEFAAASQQLAAQGDQLVNLLEVIYISENQGSGSSSNVLSLGAKRSRKKLSKAGGGALAESRGKDPSAVIPLDDKEAEDVKDLKDVSGF